MASIKVKEHKIFQSIVIIAIILSGLLGWIVSILFTRLKLI